MSLDACAALVERGDPWRWRCLLAAPVATRARLLPLYALNVEVSRAPWVTQEPMIAEMRLQWWRDALEEIAQGGPVRAHEVATPLAQVITQDQAAQLDVFVAARIWDAYTDPFEDEAARRAYITDSAGLLMRIAAEVLGARDALADAAQARGFAGGVASFLLAVSTLTARGKQPVADTADIADLARRGRVAAQAARTGARALPRAARAALWPALGADRILRQAEQSPESVLAGQLSMAEGPRRAALLWQSVRP